MKRLRPDLYSVGSLFVRVHLLVDEQGIVIVDTGFFRDLHRIRLAVSALGREPSDVKAIFLTHGHFDHTMNASRLKEWSGAKVYAPAGDELHVAGRYPYCGISRVCGWLEGLGRAVTRYRAPDVDVWFRDGDELPFWGGLKVVSLPGHTAGHCGFLSEAKRTLFVGDAFAASWRIVLPPPIFNTNSAQVRESFRRCSTFDVNLLVPAHYFVLNEAVMKRVREKAGNFNRTP